MNTTWRHRLVAVGATLAMLGATTTPAGASAGASEAVALRPRHATYSTALSGVIPCSVGRDYDLGCGRMKNGRLAVRRGAPRGSHINIKGIESSSWRRTSVRFVDVAGSAHKEAVVIISASAGGVGWPNVVTVYDGNGKLLMTWDSAAATQAGRKGGASGAREGTSFGRRTTATSVDLVVRGIAVGNQCEACGTGADGFRLSKGKNGKPVIRRVSRRN